MAPAKALEQLALQKQLLIAESEAHRLVLASALHRVSWPVRWADRVSSQLRPLLVVGAPAAVFWFGRRSRGMKRWVSTGLGVLRVVQSLRKYLHRSNPR